MPQTQSHRTLAILHSRIAVLDGILQVAQDHWGDDDAMREKLVETRLAPDMFPFNFQPFLACHQVKMYLDWDAGTPGENDTPGQDWAAMRAQVKATLARLDDAIASEYSPPAPDKSIVMGRMGMKIDLPQQDFVDDWVLPNLYFHVTTTYAMLRQAGVPLSKGNFMAYLMPRMKKTD